MNGAGQQQQQQPQKNISLSLVIHRLVEQSYNNLIALSERLPSANDFERKKQLVEYLDGTRQKFLRLLVLLKWSNHVSTLTKANEIIELLNLEDSYFRDAADLLIMTKENLINARAPIYDVPTAIDVLTSGSYQRMPTDIRRVIPPAPLSSNQIATALDRLNNIICYKLFLCDIPKEFEPIQVDNGKAHIIVKNEYDAYLSIDGGNEKANWVLVSFNLNIYSQKDRDGEGPIKVAYDAKMKQVSDRIQNRIMVSPQPLYELHNIIHYLVISSHLDILSSQMENLKKTVLKGNIRCVNGKDQSITIFYWIPEDMNTVAGPSHSLDELHAYYKVNLLFNLLTDDRARTNKALGNQASANKSFLLHEIKLIQSSSKLDAKATTDESDALSTILRVQLYGLAYLDVTVNFQNGRYTLILSSSSFKSNDLITNLENKLNTDLNEIKSIVNTFKLKSLLACFEEEALFLHLECFYKIPLTADLFNEQNYICLRFPKDRDIFYLVISIQPTSFIPTFYLIYCKSIAQSAIMNYDSIVKVESDDLTAMIKECECDPKQFKAYTSALIRKLVQVARQKINQLSVAQHLKRENIPYNVLDDSITFLALPPNSIVQTSLMTISFLDDHHCCISFTELQPFQYHHPIGTHNHITNTGTEWKFVYNTSTDWLTTYQNDIISVNKIINLSTQLLKYLKIGSEHSSMFQLISIRPMDIEFVCSNSTSSKSIIKVYVNKAREISIDFQPITNPLLSLFERDLNKNMDIDALLKSIAVSNEVIFSIQSIVAPNNTIFLLPLEVYVIPRSVSQIRITYKNQYGIDIRLVSTDSCIVEDAYFTNIAATMNLPTTKTRLNNIPFFQLIMESKMNVPALDNPLGQRTSYLVPTKVLKLTLQKVILFFNTVHFSKYFQAPLKNEFKEATLSSFSMRFANESILFHICVRDYATFELEIGSKDPAAPIMSLEERTLLSYFFKKKVNNLSFRLQTIASFVQIFTVPPFVLLELIKVLSGDRATPPLKYLMEVALNTTNTRAKEPPFHHNKERGLITFIIRYHIRRAGGESGTLQELFLDMPLVYHYRLNSIKFWNKNDLTDIESTNNLSTTDQSKLEVIDKVRLDLEQQGLAAPTQPSILYAFSKNLMQYIDLVK
eukprot:gene3656-4202_t